MKKILTIFGVTAVSILAVFLLGYALTGWAVSTSVQVKVTVLPIYKLYLNSELHQFIVNPGSSLPVEINIWKKDLTNNSEKKINVELRYELLRGNKVVASGTLKNVTLKDKVFTGTVTIKIPSNFRDLYTVKIIAEHPQAYPAETKERFYVAKKFWWF